MPPFRVEEGVKADIHNFIDCIFDAYSHPRHPYLDLLYPGTGRNAPEGKPFAVERYLARWEANPHERWAKVVDTATGEVAGVSRWVFYPEKPFPNGPPFVEATWYPKGSLIREYTTFLMNDRLVRQAERCTEPNVCKSSFYQDPSNLQPFCVIPAAHPTMLLFTSPEEEEESDDNGIGLGTLGVRSAYRRRGAASMMVQWGVEQADKMGVDTFVEASWDGGRVYRQFGFQYIDEFKLRRPPEREGDEEWDKLEKDYGLEIEWLCRPRRGAKGHD